MSKRRIVIDLSSGGWIGWLAFALLVIPLLILSFFFFAAMVALIAVMVLIGLARLYWLRHKPPVRGRDRASPREPLPPP